MYIKTFFIFILILNFLAHYSVFPVDLIVVITMVLERKIGNPISMVYIASFFGVSSKKVFPQGRNLLVELQKGITGCSFCPLCNQFDETTIYIHCPVTTNVCQNI